MECYEFSFCRDKARDNSKICMIILISSRSYGVTSATFAHLGFTNQLVKIKIKTRGYYEIKICMGHTRTIFLDCI